MLHRTHSLLMVIFEYLLCIKTAEVKLVLNQAAHTNWKGFMREPG